MPIADPLDLHMPAAMQAELFESYQSPGRHYHTWGHIERVMDCFEDIRLLIPSENWQHPREAYLALLYHDAVYDPTRSTNELNSARMAVDAIERWLPEWGIDTERVRRMILWTQHHTKSKVRDHDTRILLDCDLSSLGAEPERFDQDCANIRLEYALVPDAIYNSKRAELLWSFLDRPAVFRTQVFQIGLMERRAQANLRREIERLGVAS